MRTTAFDLWLRHGLAELFADVLREPVPNELLRLLDGEDAER